MTPINFDTLPGDKPNQLPAKGTYFATVENPEMKQPKDPNKPPYLNIRLALRHPNGKSAGKIFDLFTESDHELVRYKLQRFITALQIPIMGTFELKDLCKVIGNKQLIVDVTTEEKEGFQPKAIVDVFAGQVYYPLTEANSIFESTTVADDDSPFINAPDAADAISEAEEDY
jgi:hypothetical protein